MLIIPFECPKKFLMVPRATEVSLSVSIQDILKNRRKPPPKLSIKMSLSVFQRIIITCQYSANVRNLFAGIPHFLLGNLDQQNQFYGQKCTKNISNADLIILVRKTRAHFFWHIFGHKIGSIGPNCPGESVGYPQISF